MKVILFGATGMIGQGVLHECLLAPDVTQVLAIGRTATNIQDPKLRELIRPDLFDYGGLDSELTGWDGCFFCLGVSAAGMANSEYERLTYMLTMAAAETLARLNAQRMTFIYVSGAGTDSTEQGRIAWARVKGRTENALRRLPFKAVYLFRPGIIEASYGERSKTKWSRISYSIINPVLPLLRRLLPGYIVSTSQIGQAMLAAVRRGAPKAVLEIRDIIALHSAAESAK